MFFKCFRFGEYGEKRVRTLIGNNLNKYKNIGAFNVSTIP